MAQLYGHKWTSSYGDSDEGNIWLAALKELTPDQLKAGLNKCAASGESWPPSAPEFRAMCMPQAEDYGLPDKHKAWAEACNNSHQVLRHKWSHPAVYQAGKGAGWHEIKSASNQQAVKQSFMQAYESACNVIMSGGYIEIPKIRENALEQHQNGEKVTTEEAKAAGEKAIAEMRKSLRI